VKKKKKKERKQKKMAVEEAKGALMAIDG